MKNIIFNYEKDLEIINWLKALDIRGRLKRKNPVQKCEENDEYKFDTMMSSVHSSRNQVGFTSNFASRYTKYQDLRLVILIPTLNVIPLSEMCKAFYL